MKWKIFDFPLVGQIHYTVFHLTQVGFPLWCKSQHTSSAVYHLLILTDVSDWFISFILSVTSTQLHLFWFTNPALMSLIKSVIFTSPPQSSDPQGQCLAAPQTPLPTYKQKFDEFKKLFKELPESERLIVGELQRLLLKVMIVHDPDI